MSPIFSFGTPLRSFSLTSTKAFVYNARRSRGNAKRETRNAKRFFVGGQVGKTNLPRPTDAELAILRVLWRRGPSTVRQAQEELNQISPTGYTTVLKMLQIMIEKGLVSRDETERSHVYEAAVPEEET